MKKIIIFSLITFLAGTGSFAQNVAINTDATLPNSSAMLDVKSTNKGMLIPRVALTGTADVSTIASPAISLMVYNTTSAGIGTTAVIPGYYYWTGAAWARMIASNTAANPAYKTLIPFSSGVIRSGATVVSAAPVLLGFGSSTVEVINGLGESTSPPEAGGFSFVVPFSGVIENLQVSADLLVASIVSINTVGLQYDFTVFVSPSVPNNGIDHPAQPYTTSPFFSSVRFGFPYTSVTPGFFRSATNINTGSIAVNAGDRVGIRVRTSQITDASAADITQLSFSASVIYSRTQ